MVSVAEWLGVASQDFPKPGPRTLGQGGQAKDEAHALPGGSHPDPWSQT